MSRRSAVRLDTHRWTLFCVTSLFAVSACSWAQSFSEWIQSTGYKKVEFRWRENDAKGCDLEYRNADDRDRRRYKTRIVFQFDGDEHVKPYAILSFADPAPHTDSIPACSVITDISVTRF